MLNNVEIGMEPLVLANCYLSRTGEAFVNLARQPSIQHSPPKIVGREELHSHPTLLNKRHKGLRGRKSKELLHVFILIRFKRALR